MRQIKFRAWDINKKKFIPYDVYAIVTTDFKAFGVMLKDWEDYKEGEYFYENTQVVQQFTGLLDKNGREIYEGDILIEQRELISRKYKVWFEEGGFVINEFQDDFTRPINQIHFWQGLSDMQTASYVKQNCEIIGNVFETPNLLEK